MSVVLCVRVFASDRWKWDPRPSKAEGGGKQ